MTPHNPDGPARTPPEIWLLLAVLAWTTVAFGGVYPWAYWPALACAAAAGARGAARGPARAVSRAVRACLLIVAGAIALQTVPLPPPVALALSPELPRFLAEYTVGYGLSADRWRPLSVAPLETLRGLAFVVTVGLVILGTAAARPRETSVALARSVCALGSAIALAAIVQHAAGTARVYGFWTARAAAAVEPFGPFINRNHFAGWMLLAIPLGLGYLGALVSRRRPRPFRSVRDRLVWLSSPEASELLLVAGALTLMSIALIMTRSRSGVLAMAVVTVLSAGAMISRQPTWPRRLSATAFCIALLGFGLAATGTDALAARFRDEHNPVSRRLQIWQDGVNLFQRYPVAGTGWNTYGTSMLLYQSVDRTLHYRAAHNDYVQALAEGGLLVGLPVALALGVLATEIGRRLSTRRLVTASWVRLGAGIGIVALAVQETVEFSLQIPAVAILFALSCGLVVGRTSGSGHRSSRQAASDGDRSTSSD